MSLTSIILTSIIISLFCCGWRVVTAKGMALNFLKIPFDKLQEWKDNKELNNLGRVWYELQKPIIGCVTCFSSFWGVIVFYLLHHNLSINTIVCCVISAFLNTLFYNLYERI